MRKLMAFKAAWCGPCKMLTPVLKELQTEGYDIEMIDVDEGEEEGWKKELRYFWVGDLRRGLVALGLAENTTHRHAV